jgi:hypothetical protein
VSPFSAAKLILTPGLQWVLRTTNDPSARISAAMAYDTKRGLSVLFGGLGLDPIYPIEL